MSPRHWRVRSKLAAVLVVPAIAFLVLAGLNVTTSVRSAQQYGRGATIAEFGRQTTSLVHELQAERDLSAGYISEGRKAPDSKLRNASFYLQEQLKNVDPALAMFRSARTAAEEAVGSQAKAKIDLAAATLNDLDSLRKAVTAQKLTEAAALGQYTRMISALLDVDLEIGQRSGSRDLTQSVTALNDLSRAKEAASQVRGQLYSVGFLKAFQFNQFQQLSAALADQQATLERFRTDANDQQRAVYDEQVNGQAVLTVKRIEEQAINRQQAPELNIDPQQWYAAATTRIELIRAVESSLLDSVISQARTLRSDAQRAAISTGVIIAAILVIALLTSLLIARSMVRPLRRLRDSARDVAENRLPAAIERLRTDSGQADVPVEPIGIDTRDEIGEVAKTFDAIHLRAIELATQQAALRSNVNSMFVNLSRRTQSLVERQLKLIDELETGEQDPDQLSNLFKLDHLATRMRRNSENLLVLAGEDAGRRWGRPIPLVDVLRAATSEVEQYHRIQLTGVPDVEVMGHAVNHVVHLVAELLENATVFSSPESKVLVHSQRLSDGGAMVEIEDRGIGMTAQEIADANERLAHPPMFDVSISRMMGLFVVGRLAGRHGITVRLRQSELGGVSAFVRLTSEVLASRFDPRVGEPVSDAGRPIVRSGAPALPPPGPPVLRPGLAGLVGELPRRQLPAGSSGPDVGPDRGMPIEPMREIGPGVNAGPPTRTPPGAPPLPRRTPAASAGPANLPAGFRDGLGPEGDGVPGRPGMPAYGRPPGGARPPGVPAAAGMDGGAAVPLNALTSPHQGSARGAEEEMRLPIFEQLQSEWFRRRTSSARAAAADQPRQPGLAAAGGPAAARPAGTAPGPGAPRPAAARPGTGPAAGAGGHPGVPAAGPVPSPAGPPRMAGPPPGAAGPPEPELEPWQSPADEGWRAAERLLSPTTGGVTRAGLPMRVPQAHLVPGAADQVPAPAPAPATSRSPEAVRSRLASYHQGVRRGRHSDRRGENADRDPSDVLVQTQEQT